MEKYDDFDDDSKYELPNQNYNYTNDSEDLDEILINNYIGKNADKINTGMYNRENYNVIAMLLGELFGPLWFFYRKSYLYGFIILIVSILIAGVLNTIGLGLVYIAIGIPYLYFANKIYLSDVKRKINKIKDKNREKSVDELIEIVQKKGGTSILACAIYMLILISPLIIIASIVLCQQQSMMKIALEPNSATSALQETMAKANYIQQTGNESPSSNNTQTTNAKNIELDNTETNNIESDDTMDTSIKTLKNKGIKVNVPYPIEYDEESVDEKCLKVSNDSLGRYAELNLETTKVDDYIKNKIKSIKDNSKNCNFKMSDIGIIKAKDKREYKYVKFNYTYNSALGQSDFEEVYAVTQLNKNNCYIVQLSSNNAAGLRNSNWHIPDNAIRTFLNIKILTNN